MIDVLAVSLHGMQQDAMRLERISGNLANAMTPGYKREVVAALSHNAAASPGSFATTLQELRAQPASDAGNDMIVKPDLRPGTLRATHRPLDVALAGPGYFEVATDGGAAYTRQGAFQVDPRGRLVTAAGAHPVIGMGGEIVLSQTDPVVDAAGKIYERRADGSVDSAPVAQLKVVDLDAGSIQAQGSGLMGSTSTAPAELSQSDLQIRQGYLENANVNSTHEMVQLIQTMRHFESMQKVAPSAIPGPASSPSARRECWSTRPTTSR